MATQERAAGLAAMEAKAPNVQNGTYTVEGGPAGHFTVKLHTALRGNLAGKRILSLLVGPDNTSDYKWIAFWDDAAKRCNVWRRFTSPTRGQPVDAYNWGDHWNSHEKKLAIWCDLAVRGGFGEDGGFDEGTSHWASNGYTLLREGRCYVCNRKLTDPESIRLGIGPVCASR